MQNNNKFILIFFILLSINPFCAYTKIADFQSSVPVPVEWQAIKLQENIEDKIKRSLNPIIKENDYIIEVKIGFDIDKAEDPSSKKVTKTIQQKKVKFSNSALPADGDDFVVFNKLGLEAPIVGDEPVETITSEVELAQKAMIEMNDRFNLFNFLNTIDIKLTFDKDIPEKGKINIKKIIEGLSFNTKDVIPQINIQYLELKESMVKNDPKLNPDLLGIQGKEKEKEKNKDKVDPAKINTSLPERFKNLDIMIGLIISALIFALVALYITHIGSKVDETNKNKNENMNEGGTEDLLTEKREEDDLPEDDDMTIDLQKTDIQTMRINEGLERFRKIFTHHRGEAIHLIKGWIKIGKGNEGQALKGLVQLLEDNELSEIFKFLTIDERGSWKMCLDGELNKDELSKAYIYISNTIIQMMMVPALIDDYEICDLLLLVTAEEASKFCVQHPQLGVVFTNVLSAKTISDMFKLMPLEAVTDIIERSSLFKQQELLALMPLLKETLMKVKQKRESRPPFLKRIIDILPTVNFEIEKKLYGTLVKHLSIDDICEFAIKIFPYELMNRLPNNIYKDVVGKMSIEIQVEYFVAQGEERVTQLDRIASKGSKSREMIEFEVNAILKNEILTKKIIVDKKTTIDQEFLLSIRDFISVNPETHKEINIIMREWLGKIKEDIEKEIKESALISHNSEEQSSQESKNQAS